MGLIMKALLFVTTSAILSSSFLQAAETPPTPVTVNGGTVNFKGEFVNAPCVVSSDTANQTVDLGQYRTASLTAKDAQTAKVPFEIKLVNCDATTLKTASFAFYGTADSANPNLLGVVASSANAEGAKGVGIGIYDAAGTLLKPDGATQSVKTKLLDGTTTVNFSANYVATAAVTAGEANSSANFMITYE